MVITPILGYVFTFLSGWSSKRTWFSPDDQGVAWTQDFRTFVYACVCASFLMAFYKVWSFLRCGKP